MTGAALAYGEHDALALAELIAQRHVSPTELLAAARDRAEAVNPHINAFAQLFFDRAQAQIDEGLPKGPLSGVPFAVKDLGQELTGTVTTSGSRIWKNSRAAADSTLVSRYKRAGLLIVGKTTSPELGLTMSTESALHGPTRNPWNLNRTSGGSSGGAAAAVAARIVPAAHGSDGGGSIRVPASCCGLFGLKPTRGRVPMGPRHFEGWSGLSCHHVVTRSVRDSAALLDATAGGELGAPFFSPKPEHAYLVETRLEPARLRIALALEPPGHVSLDRECRNAALEAAKVCETLGHVIDETRLPVDDEQLRETLLTIIHVSVARVLGDAASTLEREVAKHDVESVTWAMSQRGREVDAVAYATVIGTMHQIGLEMATFQKEYDVILSPTLAKPPVSLGVLSLSQLDPNTFAREVWEFGPYTALYNVTGQPSMSVPLYWTPEGLPVGVMFSARFGDEATLFRLANQLEQARPWSDRRPSLPV